MLTTQLMLSVLGLMMLLITPAIVVLLYFLVPRSFHFTPDQSASANGPLVHGRFFGHRWVSDNRRKWWISSRPTIDPSPPPKLVVLPDGWRARLNLDTLEGSLTLAAKAFFCSVALGIIAALFGLTLPKLMTNGLDVWNVWDEFWRRLWPSVIFAGFINGLLSAFAAGIIAAFMSIRTTKQVSLTGQTLRVDGRTIHLANAGTTSRLAYGLFGTVLVISNPTKRVVVRGNTPYLAWLSDQIHEVSPQEAKQIPQQLLATAATAVS